MNEVSNIKKLVNERITNMTIQNQNPLQSPKRLLPKQSNATIVNGSPNLKMNSIESINYCINRNEDADAHLFVFKNSERCRYDYDEGAWYIFNGVYWEKDLSNQVMKLFRDVIAWYEAAKQFIKSGKSDKLNDLLEDVTYRIKHLSSLNRKRNVLALAQGDLGVSSAQWDADPMLLGFKNGVVDLRTGEFRKGDPEDFIRTICPVEWKGLNEPCPTWKGFHSEILIDDAQLISFIQRLLGSTISGKTREHVFIIFYGIGRNGKGTILEMMKWLLGGMDIKLSPTSC
jgi:putative DNA primase/helicase